MGSSSSKTKRKPAAPQSAPPAQSSSFITSLTAICVALAVTSFLLLQSGYLRPSPHGLRVSGNMSINPAARRTVGYFVNWGIYGRKYQPQDIPAPLLTHINYAFANVNKDTGEVFLSDTWADVEIHYAGDDWNEPGTNLYGCLKAIYLMKKANRNLKVLMSIGGWSYSPNFANIVQPAWRAKFVETSVRMVEDVGLDGLDIDYEYPKTPADAEGYVQLLRDLRMGLDHLASTKGKRRGQYQLTVAAPCGPDNMSVLRIREMDQYLDFWNLMAYDFAGSWDSVAGHQANLFSAQPGGVSVDEAVRYYTNAGVHPNHLVIGMPLYGRAFAQTQGIGHPYNGVGEGSWENGMWDYKALPQPGAQEYNDFNLGASYSYDQSKGLLISYDTPAIAVQKARFIDQNHLGGAMWWELDADKPAGQGSLVEAVRMEWGQLEWKENELDYPGSKYENLRRRME